MAIVASFPNLFVGIIAAFDGIPELSFGDIVGNSVVDFTLVAAIAVFVGKELKADGPLIQKSLLFTIFIAILPLLLILDKELGRGDALALLLIFILYSIWLFSNRQEYTQIFNPSNRTESPNKQVETFARFHRFIQSVFKTFAALLLLVGSAQGIVHTIQFFVAEFRIPMVTVGILVLGLGSALPEIYFTIVAAKRGNSRIILGDLLGSIIVMATLVLGIVALIHPISIDNFSPFALARIFLLASALFFLVFLRTGHTITRKEAVFLLALYIAFMVGEIIVRTMS